MSPATGTRAASAGAGTRSRWRMASDRPEARRSKEGAETAVQAAARRVTCRRLRVKARAVAAPAPIYMTGIEKSAPERMPVGQRAVMVFSLV